MRVIGEDNLIEFGCGLGDSRRDTGMAVAMGGYPPRRYGIEDAPVPRLIKVGTFGASDERKSRRNGMLCEGMPNW